MSRVLYSIKCYIKNDPYRLSIYVEEDEQNLTSTSFDTDSANLAFATISVSDIVPSLTRLSFERLNKRNNNSTMTIALSHLLNIEQTQGSSRRNREYFNHGYEILDENDEVTLVNGLSREVSQGTLDTLATETTIEQTPISRQQFKFRKAYVTQLSAQSGETSPFRTIINIKHANISDSIRWDVKTLKLQLETEEKASQLYANLELCLSTLKQRPRHLLAFVNPFGGKGRAKTVYEKKVLPIFEQANIRVESIHTKHTNHARDYVINEDLSEYDGLICVGGDGIFAELCHGLLLRTAQEAQLNIDDPNVKIIRPDIRIGIIPAGSTDAVVFGTTGLNDPVTSALQIVVGESLFIDIATVHNEKGFVRFMATMLAYGFFGDIIQQSDKWRCLGPFRYDLAGFWHFIRHRSYHSEITITLSPNDSSWVTHLPMNNTTNETITTNVRDSDQLSTDGCSITDETNPGDDSLTVLDKIVTPGLVFCSRNCKRCALEEVQNSTNDQSSSKLNVEGRFTTINCLNMPCRCAKSRFGMSPFVHLGDGTFDLVLVKSSWRTSFLRFLWQVANDSRSIEELPNVERYRASEVLIHPMHTSRRRLGHWSCDGELISATEIRVRIHRQTLNLFASGIQFSKLTEYNSMKNKHQSQKDPPDIPKSKK